MKFKLLKNDQINLAENDTLHLVETNSGFEFLYKDSEGVEKKSIGEETILKMNPWSHMEVVSSLVMPIVIPIDSNGYYIRVEYVGSLPPFTPQLVIGDAGEDGPSEPYRVGYFFIVENLDFKSFPVKISALLPGGSIDGETSIGINQNEIRMFYHVGSNKWKTIIIRPFSIETSTSFSFKIPKGYSSIEFDVRGATGGGGSGASGARPPLNSGLTYSEPRYPGNGGGCGGLGGRWFIRLPIETFTQPTIGITIGSSGKGGAEVSTPTGTVNIPGTAGKDGTAGGTTTVTFSSSHNVSIPGGAGGKGATAPTNRSESVSGAIGTRSLVNETPSSYSTNRYFFINCVFLNGVLGTPSNVNSAQNMTSAPGGTGSQPATDPLAAGPSGKGGNGGPSYAPPDLEQPSIGQAGGDGVPGKVIIRGIV